MESKNYLGIYISKQKATVVCLDSHGQNVLGLFTVSIEETEGSNLQTLADLIAKGCTERGLQFFEASLAVDCSMFMQHRIHSEFDDQKQIAATIRFDTEEALAVDISDVAVAFEIISSGQNGSQLAVFTAQQKILSQLLLSLQSNNIDPIAVEPDVNCLSRFIHRNIPLGSDTSAFFCILSQRNGYFIVPPADVSHGKAMVRTFLIGRTQNRNQLLKKQVPLTIALVETGEPISRLKVFDSAGSVDCQQLTDQLGITTEAVDLTEAGGLNPEVLADCEDNVDFAIACGAALTHLEKTRRINFRDDFMPYLGRKRRMQKTLKIVSISLVVFMIAAGLYFQSKLFKELRPVRELRNRFAKEYVVVMSGKKLPTRTSALKKLKAELRRIKDVKGGKLSVTGKKTVAAKLTMAIDAFNRCAKQTGLDIDEISVTSKHIKIKGSTAGRKSTIQLRQAIEQSNLKVSQDSIKFKDGRDNFRITVVPKNK